MGTSNKNLLTKEFAEQIVQTLHGVTGSNVNVMGEGGVILASIQKERIGQVHEAARRIMAGEVDEVAITEEMARTMEGARPGYNGAISFEGQRIGCIGISGDPELTRPLQKLAAIIFQEDLTKQRSKGARKEMLLSLADEIEDVADQMRVLAINGSIQASKLGSKGDPFKVVVGEVSKLVGQISETLDRVRFEASE